MLASSAKLSQGQFSGNAIGKVLNQLAECDLPIGQAYFLRDIYNGLNNPQVFFGKPVTAALISEVVFAVRRMNLDPDALRIFLDDLPMTESKSQKSFHGYMSSWLLSS